MKAHQERAREGKAQWSFGGFDDRHLPFVQVIKPSADCKKAIPASIGLSPLALANQTGNHLEIPDHLIVAARHEEARFPLPLHSLPFLCNV